MNRSRRGGLSPSRGPAGVPGRNENDRAERAGQSSRAGREADADLARLHRDGEREIPRRYQRPPTSAQTSRMTRISVSTSPP